MNIVVAKRDLRINWRNQERYHEHQWHGSSSKSCKRSVILEKTDPLSELSVPRDWPSSWTGSSGWSCWKFGKSLPAIDRDDFKSSTESTISTSLIQNIASERELVQELTWVLNLIFQNMNDDGVVNLANWSSDICCLLFNHRIVWNFRWLEGIHGWRPSCRHRHKCCAPNSFFTSRDKSPCTSLHWDCTCGTMIRRVKSSLTWIAKNVSLCPRRIPCNKWQAFVAA